MEQAPEPVWPAAPPAPQPWTAPAGPGPNQPPSSSPGSYPPPGTGPGPYAPPGTGPAVAQPGMPGHGPASGGEQIGIGLDARCYQHPERLAGSVCRSCNRPICADCMVQAPVGWQCRPCVRRNAKTSPVIRYRPGASNATGLRSIPVTLGLIVACTIVWLVELAQPPLEINWSVVGIAIQQGGEWYRLFTAMFIHYSWPHIALNMLSLYFVGRALEPVLGWWRYLALYLVAGFGGDLAAYLFTSPLVPVGGASGAIFGIFGAYFVFARRARVDTSRIVTILVINLVYSFSISGISWQGHVGGLITGVAIAAGYGRVKDRRYRVVADLGAAASAFVVLAVISVLPLGLPRVG